MNALFGGLFSILGRLIRGGCFVGATPVTVSEWPSLVELRNSNSSTRSWSGESGRSGTLVQRKVAIESLSIGSRVPTKNPNRWEVAPQAEPDPATWAKLSITVERSDGGVIDAELIRPRSWMEAYDLRAGRTMRLNLPELEVSGVATITAISACPPIATGEGSVITARFMTRQVDEVTSVEILGADGATETITGTSIHPVWSVDRQVWVPLAELSEGETLQGSVGPAIVLSVSLSRVSQPVYNVEVHNEHVYQVGELGVLVHNATPARCAMIAEYGEEAMRGWQAAHIIPKNGWGWAPKELMLIIDRVKNEGLIDNVANLFASTPGHAGTHTKPFVDDLIDVMIDRHSTESMIEGINLLWRRIKAGKY